MIHHGSLWHLQIALNGTYDIHPFEARSTLSQGLNILLSGWVYRVRR